MIQIKRVYEPYEKEDGYRILVDRLWPRGLSKERAHIDIWLKDIGPSNELRKWFGHDEKNWEAFEQKYKKELEKKKDVIDQLKNLIKGHKKVTIVYGAKDTQHNQAVVLQGLV